MKISVVMATYNGEKFILEQLESILNQSKKPDEVIICDDCSQDSTVQLIKKFIEQNSLINWKVYINSSNMGYSGNFTNAMKLATGEIIFLADQDDIWLQSKIERMYEIMEKHESIKLLASNVIPFYLEGNKNTVNYEQFGSKELVKINFSARWIKPIRPGCSFCFRKELLKDYDKLWFKGYPHDCLLWGLANIKNGAYLFNNSTIKFRRHGSNASSNGNRKLDYRLKSIINEIEIAEKMLSFIYSNVDQEINSNVSVFIEKQKNIYKKRYNALETKKLLKTLTLLPCIKYFGRSRFWLTDLYYILKCI